MRITDEICGTAARRAKGYRNKARQFGVCAPVKFIHDSAGHYGCSRELTWLASGMATKAEICVMLYDPAGPTGEGSAPSVAAAMITPTAVIPRIVGLFSICCKWQTALHL
jgi:hypothetical protein